MQNSRQNSFPKLSSLSWTLPVSSDWAIKAHLNKSSRAFWFEAAFGRLSAPPSSINYYIGGSGQQTKKKNDAIKRPVVCSLADKKKASRVSGLRTNRGVLIQAFSYEPIKEFCHAQARQRVLWFLGRLCKSWTYIKSTCSLAAISNPPPLNYSEVSV